MREIETLKTITYLGKLSSVVVSNNWECKWTTEMPQLVTAEVKQTRVVSHRQNHQSQESQDGRPLHNPSSYVGHVRISDGPILFVDKNFLDLRPWAGDCFLRRFVCYRTVESPKSRCLQCGADTWSDKWVNSSNGGVLNYDRGGQATVKLKPTIIRGRHAFDDNRQRHTENTNTNRNEMAPLSVRR